MVRDSGVSRDLQAKGMMRFIEQRTVLVSHTASFWLIFYLCISECVDVENGVDNTLRIATTVSKAKVGTADFLIELENRRSIKVSL